MLEGLTFLRQARGTGSLTTYDTLLRGEGGAAGPLLQRSRAGTLGRGLCPLSPEDCTSKMGRVRREVRGLEEEETTGQGD